MKVIKNTLISKLHEYTGLPIPDLDSGGRRPEYPFLSLKVTSPYIDRDKMVDVDSKAVESLDDRFRYDILETRHSQPHGVISISSYSKSLEGAYSAIKGCYDWVKHIGYYDLQDINVVVVEVQDIQDRTINIEDVYIEYRYGFDFRVRYMDKVGRRIETIEEANIQKGDEW